MSHDLAPPWTEKGLLAALRSAGAPALEWVRFKSNRRTIWSVTSAGKALNLHEGYRSAPWALLRHFAAIVTGDDTRETGVAMSAVRGWSGLEPAVARARRRTRKGARTRRLGPREVRPGPCCASRDEIERVRALFLRLNRERFQSALPQDVHLRLSRRMKSRLGHMHGHVRAGRRVVVEIALGADLLLQDNRKVLHDTLLHEMAHAADWLFHGGRGHGATWKAWALRVGCEPRACTRAVVVRDG